MGKSRDVAKKKTVVAAYYRKPTDVTYSLINWVGILDPRDHERILNGVKVVQDEVKNEGYETTGLVIVILPEVEMDAVPPDYLDMDSSP